MSSLSHVHPLQLSTLVDMRVLCLRKNHFEGFVGGRGDKLDLFSSFVYQHYTFKTKKRNDFYYVLTVTALSSHILVSRLVVSLDRPDEEYSTAFSGQQPHERHPWRGARQTSALRIFAPRPQQARGLVQMLAAYCWCDPMRLSFCSLCLFFFPNFYIINFIIDLVSPFVPSSCHSRYLLVGRRSDWVFVGDEFSGAFAFQSLLRFKQNMRLFSLIPSITPSFRLIARSKDINTSSETLILQVIFCFVHRSENFTCTRIGSIGTKGLAHSFLLRDLLLKRFPPGPPVPPELAAEKFCKRTKLDLKKHFRRVMCFCKFFDIRSSGKVI